MHTVVEGSVPADYRIDDLAREAGTTVRSLRVLHDKGLLPAPKLRGRVGWYDDDHLTRVRLVLRLQERGFTLSAIAHLLAAWENGRDLGEVLGLEEALIRPWTDEAPVPMSETELRARFGDTLTKARVERAERLGMLRVDEDGSYTVRSRRLVEVGAGLLAIGVPMDTVLDLSETMRTDMTAMIRRITSVVNDHMLSTITSLDGLPDAQQVTQFTEAVNALRIFARISFEEWFALIMDDAAGELIGSMGEWARDVGARDGSAT